MRLYASLVRQLDFSPHKRTYSGIHMDAWTKAYGSGCAIDDKFSKGFPTVPPNYNRRARFLWVSRAFSIVSRKIAHGSCFSTSFRLLQDIKFVPIIYDHDFSLRGVSWILPCSIDSFDSHLDAFGQASFTSQRQNKPPSLSATPPGLCHLPQSILTMTQDSYK